jgi:hypothetical protein
MLALGLGLASTDTASIETQSKLKLAEYSATLDVLTQQLISKTDEVAKQEIALRFVRVFAPFCRASFLRHRLRALDVDQREKKMEEVLKSSASVVRLNVGGKACECHL